ncbi:hypothetical protein [Marinifilum sp. D714]|uniref:hypothetical protein n=1 Tax=Marinifilum sp. D714 TaxID=2937523 RepID=UPI0027CAD453|nr:hypothetical protein [Marinifilum sp. D714]MDQ2180514.1 hypothetical protein [Marinifilum sp. D714]
MKNKKQKIYLGVALIVLAASQLLTHFYRPYIYANKISDFGFADTIGSLVSVIGFCFFVWGFKDYSNKEKNKHILLATIIYSVVWEPLGWLGIHGTFDWKDIIASFISGAIALALKEIVERSISAEPHERTRAVAKGS